VKSSHFFYSIASWSTVLKLDEISFTGLFSLIEDTIRVMGGIQRAGTGKNEKVTEISPLLAFGLRAWE